MEEKGGSEIRIQANLRERLREAGLIGSHTKITGQRDAHARARGRPIHRRNHELGHIGNGQTEFLAGHQHGLKLSHGSPVSGVAYAVEVAAGAKSAAGAGKHDDVHRFIISGAQKPVHQGTAGFGIEGVQFFRTIQAKGQNTVGTLFEDSLRACALRGDAHSGY